MNVLVPQDELRITKHYHLKDIKETWEKGSTDVFRMFYLDNETMNFFELHKLDHVQV